jgi:hypothetical protein
MNSEHEWTVYRTRFLVRACQLTQQMVFTDALGREHSGEPGDYLVESSEGCFRITPREIFEDVYVPLAASPPGETLDASFETNVSQEGTRSFAYREATGSVVPCSA